MRVTELNSELGLANSAVRNKIHDDPGRSFAGDLKAMVSEVNSLQNDAEQAMQQAAVTGAENIHETMLQVEEANLSMRLMLKVRGKALDAYQQIMRMQF